MNFRFVFRDIVHSSNQAVIFIFCVVLSLVSVVAVNSFRTDVRKAILRDAKALHGADIILSSYHDFTVPLKDEVLSIESELDVASSRTFEFYSVVRVRNGQDSLLSNIKGVESNYPFYGTISLASGREFATTLVPGTAVVARAFLERLNLQLGDEILLAEIPLRIVDAIELESMRPVNFIELGPRVFVTADDLQKTDLLGKGSRLRQEILLKTGAESLTTDLEERLQNIAAPAQESVRSYKNAPSRIKRFFDNLLFFLSLISMFTLLLAGIGMQSSLTALLRRKQQSIAIMRSFGATGPFLIRHYITLVLVLTLIGCVLGVLAGGLFEKSFTLLFQELLPENIQLQVSIVDVLESSALGILVVMFFTSLPLLRVYETKPAEIFSKQKRITARKTETVVLVLAGAVLLTGLVIRQLEALDLGLYFIVGIVALIGVLYLFATSIFACLLRIETLSLVLRQALRSLVRPGYSTRPVIVTIASAIAVLFSISLVESNLHKTYITSYPEDAPNLFCLDIQKDQRQKFLDLVQDDALLFPVIRARLTSINGSKIVESSEKIRRGDSLTREFNLTYREKLLDDEKLQSGDLLFGEQSQGSRPVPVSVLDTVAELGNMKVGDILEFNIQGVPLKAEITSIRTRTESMLYPFFYFVFQPEVLQPAPQTFFAALKVDEKTISQLENRIVNALPNVTPINVSKTAAELGTLVRKLATIINIFASFSILAGLCILVSSILATRMERSREAVYYKILGGGRKLVTRILLAENGILALLSACCGIIVAQVASWLLCTFRFDLDYSVAPAATLLLLVTTVLLLTSLGLLSSLTIINRKPAEYLFERG